MTFGFFAVLLSFFFYINNMPPHVPSDHFAFSSLSATDVTLSSCLSPISLLHPCCLHCTQHQHHNLYVYSCWFSFFLLLQLILIYFSSFVCASAGLGSTHYQYCVHMNMKCKQVPLPLHKQLNCLLAASNTVAHSTGNPTTLTGLGRLFMGAVRHHCHCLRCSTTAPAAAATAANPFSSLAKFSCLVSALKGILDVLCYQICWSFLIEARWN